MQPGLGGNNQTMDAGVSHMLGQWRALKVSNQGQEKDSSWFISPIGDGIGKLSRLYVVGRVSLS